MKIILYTRVSHFYYNKCVVVKSVKLREILNWKSQFKMILTIPVVPTLVHGHVSSEQIVNTRGESPFQNRQYVEMYMMYFKLALQTSGPFFEIAVQE